MPCDQNISHKNNFKVEEPVVVKKEKVVEEVIEVKKEPVTEVKDVKKVKKSKWKKK